MKVSSRRVSRVANCAESSPVVRSEGNGFFLACIINGLVDFKFHRTVR